MANKYCNLDGTKKISQEYGKITEGFDKVESDVIRANGRIDTTITNYKSNDTAINRRIDTTIANYKSADTAINGRIDGHIDGLVGRHDGFNVSYNGVLDSVNVTLAIDEVNARVTNIITSSVEGVNEQEIIDARGTHPLLGNRLDALETLYGLLNPISYGLLTSTIVDTEDLGLLVGSINDYDDYRSII